MSLDLTVIGIKIGPVASEYTWKEAVLYALGVGAGVDDLDYCYEDRLKVIPSFAVTRIYDFFADFIGSSGVNLAGVLHGEHELVIHNPLPPEGAKLSSEAQITHIYDRGPGKGALVIGEVTTRDAQGRKLFTNIATIFSRLDGGFGGPDAPKEIFDFPDRAPDFEQGDCPSPDQALLYRLSGDTFALHVDPDFARASGFDRPIIHGLCTHGYACRAVIKHLFPGQPERMTRFRNRFSRPLYPGTPIKTQIWKLAEGKAVFRVINAETGEATLDRGLVEWVSQEELARRATQSIRFDGRVAIVTGGGHGLGRVYALELAQRGAKVVVNNWHSDAADEVVQEIVQAGGVAVANYDDVATLEGGERIVKAALDTFGKLDILINNAGFARDKSFANMTPEMWQSVVAVHLQGAYNVTRPAFLAMRQNGYGRIVMTTSAAGLFGNFGEVQYSAAKMGLVGMMNTLKLEGDKYNIKVNSVAPLAATKLNWEVLPEDLRDALKPECVSPLVLYLCSEECPVSGAIYNAAGGYFNRAAVVSGPGIWLGGPDKVSTPEDVAAHWQEIVSMEGAKEYPNANAALMDMLTGRGSGTQGLGGSGTQGLGEPGTQGLKDSGEQAASDKPAVAPAPGNRVQEVFAHIAERFQPEAAKGVNVIFQFRISGAEGGDWHTIIKDGACTVVAGLHDKPTTTLKMAEEDFLKLISGQLPAMQAYTGGKLKIEGDLLKSQLVQKLFKM